MKKSMSMVPHLTYCVCLCVRLCGTCTGMSHVIILCYCPDNKCLSVSLELDKQPEAPGFLLPLSPTPSTAFGYW